jgi:hypothetical protein
LETLDRRNGLIMISAISNCGLVSFGSIEKAMNADLLIRFMGTLFKNSTHNIFLIVNNLTVHQARMGAARLSRHRYQIELFHLPPYSPEINPDDYQNWGFKATSCPVERVNSKKQLLQKLFALMAYLLNSPASVRDYFKHSAERYA